MTIEKPEFTIETEDPEVTDENYAQFLTPERDPLPEDAIAEPAPETDEDMTDEEALIDRDDFDDDDDDDDDEEEPEDTEDPVDPDPNAE